jgi:phosphate-selective porin OprO/OprP
MGADEPETGAAVPDDNARSEPVRDFLRRLSPLRAVGVDSDFSVTHGVQFTDKERDITLHLGGRVFLDTVKYFEDRNSGLSKSFGVRDARLEAEAALGSEWSARASFGVGIDDTGKIALNLKNLYARYLGFAPFELTLGQQDEPFSLEEMTSSRRMTFLERGLPNAFAPGTDFGLAVRTHGNKWSGAAGVFAGDLTSDVDQGQGISGRFVVSPTFEASGPLHLGGSISLRNTTSDDNVQFFQRPEVGLADFKYVDTGRVLGADRLYRLGLEGGYIHGPFSVQGEFMHTWIGRQDGFTDVKFNGLYVFGSWFVTGETRPYIHEIGNFGPIQAQHEYGAVELAARYSRIDLTSNDIRGGFEQNATLGANWYIRPQVRMMANYVLVFADDEANGDGALIGGDHPQMFQVRLQISF